MNSVTFGIPQRRRLGLEDLIFRDFEAVLKIKTSAKPGDPRLDEIRKLYETVKAKPIFAACSATPFNGCGAVANEIVVPLYGEVFVPAHSRFSCGRAECSQLVVDSFRVSTEVVELSFPGIERFCESFGLPKPTNHLAQVLARALGIMFDNRFPKHDAVVKFFGLATEQDGEQTGE